MFGHLERSMVWEQFLYCFIREETLPDIVSLHPGV